MTILIAIMIAIIAFFIGWKCAIHPDIINNEKLKQERAELVTEINIENIKIKACKKEREELAQQYQETQQYIQDAEKNAEKIYNAKMFQLNEQYAEREKNLREIENKQKEKYTAELKQIQEDLTCLKSTKKAAIEAARKEKEITENKDAYCLILPKEEERDISLLREVQYKVSKPRAVAMCIWSNYYLPIAKEKLPKILGKNDIVGIYKLTNQKTGECYIGQSRDIKKRIYEHMRAGLGVDTPPGNQLYMAMQEYGLDNFSIELLEECNPEELNKKEKYFIELYNAKTFGYNLVAGKGK